MALNEVELPDYTGTGFKFSGMSLGEVVSKLLPYVYVAAGLSMFVMLIIGGVSLMLSGGDPAKIEKGYGMLKASLIGFFIVFLSYIIVQLVQTIFGVKIL